MPQLRDYHPELFTPQKDLEEMASNYWLVSSAQRGRNTRPVLTGEAIMFLCHIESECNKPGLRKNASELLEQVITGQNEHDEA
jgi:hypothetical protein